MTNDTVFTLTTPQGEHGKTAGVKDKPTPPVLVYIPATKTFLLMSHESANKVEKFSQEMDAQIKALYESVEVDPCAGGDVDKEKLVLARKNFDKYIADLTKAIPSKEDVQQMGPIGHSLGGGALTEIVGFRSRKFTYIPSNEKVLGEIKAEKINIDINSIRTNGKISRQKLSTALKQQIESLPNEVKEGLKTKTFEINYDIVKPVVGTWFDWAEEINKNLSAKAGKDSDYFNASAEAALMRYSYGVGLKGNLDISKGAVGLVFNANVGFALAEGEAKIEICMPSKKGILLESKKLDVNAGHFRYSYVINATGYAGVKLQCSADITLNVKRPSTASGKEDDGVAIAATSKNKAKAKGKGDGFQGANVGADAFAGVSVGCGISCAFQWKKPCTNKFEELAKVSASVEGSLGAGYTIGFNIGYENGKFVIYTEAKGTWGFGGGGVVSFSVGAEKVYDLAQFVYTIVSNSSYTYEQFIKEDALDLIEFMMTWRYRVAKRSFNFVANEAVDSFNGWANDVKGYREVIRLANNIMSSPSDLSFMLPRSRAILLRQLTEYPDRTKNYFYTLDGGRKVHLDHEKIERAILLVLRPIRDLAEYDHVIECMGENGSVDNDKKYGEKRILDALDWEDESEAVNWHKGLKAKSYVRKRLYKFEKNRSSNYREHIPERKIDKTEVKAVVPRDDILKINKEEYSKSEIENINKELGKAKKENEKIRKSLESYNAQIKKKSPPDYKQRRLGEVKDNVDLGLNKKNLLDKLKKK